MLVSLGAVTRPCHEGNEQVHYLAEKRTLFQVIQKIIQSSLPSYCWKFIRQTLVFLFVSTDLSKNHMSKFRQIFCTCCHDLVLLME